MENMLLLFIRGKYTFYFSGNKKYKKIKKVLDFWDWLRYDITCLEANSKRQYDMREWLSWWSATLPRSRPRVRVPSRAFFMQRISVRISFLHEMSPAGLKQNSENSVRGLRGPKVLFGRCYHWSPGPIAPSRAFLCKGISVRISFFCMKKARNGINVVCSIFLVTTL